MIISDKCRFVFVHIPKCAGTTVRKALQAFDSRNGRYTSRVEMHPILGELDYVHLPLFVMRDYFPGELESVRDYWSFAVMRDASARFASSVSQRLKMYSGGPLQCRSLAEIKASIDESIDYLSHQPRRNHLLPAEYIHFQKQIDYIELDGDCLVDDVYTVEQIDDLWQDVGRRVGQSLIQGTGRGSQARSNQTVVYRNNLVRLLLQAAGPLTERLGRVLPGRVKEVARSQVYVPRDSRLADVFDAEYVRDFVSDYYSDDISLYHAMNNRELGQVS